MTSNTYHPSHGSSLARQRLRIARLRDTFSRNSRVRFLTLLIGVVVVYFVLFSITYTPGAPRPQFPKLSDHPLVAMPPMPLISMDNLVRVTGAQPLSGEGRHNYGQLFESSKVAVIIESRPLENLVPLLLHFSSVLGDEWPVVLFTSLAHIVDSASLRRAISEGRIIVRNLPEGVKFETHFDVSLFLTNRWMWEGLAPAEHVLLFQTDSIICANSQERAEDFLQYDLIGAPITEEWHGQGYNGGLSLRNRTLVLEVITEDVPKHPLNAESEKDIEKYEDQWFYMRMKERGARLPSEEEAKRFSVQMGGRTWEDFPVGYHQPWEFLSEEEMAKVERYCPEVRLVKDVRILKCEPPIC